MSRVVAIFALALTFLMQEAVPVKFRMQEAAPVKTGTITGELIPPAKTRILGAVRVVLLNEDYTNLYDAEALHRLDDYWERYKPAFVESKELFYKLSQLAQTEAIEFVVDKMRQDGVDLSRMALNSKADGRFEFRNVPFGEYKVVAYGAAGANDFVWQAWLNLEKSEPVRVQLKTTLP